MTATRTTRWADNPYGSALGDADVMLALADTPDRLKVIIDRLTPEQMASSYAPGKWTATDLIVHLAQCEFVFGCRVRMALAQDAYTVQPFDQDVWLRRETHVNGRVAFEAYVAARRMNLALFTSLTPAERARTFLHPERGEMRVEWVLELMAGHERHHLPHFETIGRLGPGS